ncbi:phosphopyruvate hydratase, variant [Verruconis gallopava]|nr:phosphopyruvate hydratase, variant [Verruconis gallopava]KIW03240.1 phosphopyruvate hydratase, variant [Verruconis gallopava]
MTSVLSTIQAISAAERLDSRGNPTIQVSITTKDGIFKAIVPSGASKGDYEAVEIRDNDTKRYHGKGVRTAVNNVNDILAPAILKKQFVLPKDVDEIDRFMISKDGSDDKSMLGANAILGISMAVWRAAAAAKGFPLYQFIKDYADTKEPYVMPCPFFNVLNGGVHSGNTMAFQEMMIAPVGAQSLTEAVRMGSEVYQELKEVIKGRYGTTATGIGDEGGFAPPISSPRQALDLLTTAAENCDYSGKVKFAMDPASSEFYNKDDGTYNMGFKKTKNDPTAQKTDICSKSDMMGLYHELMDDYPLVLLEDPFAQDDWETWAEFNKNCAIPLVGDDLLATNKKRIEMAREKKACNALLLKINQIGTITEAIEA